jgi:hypothetical protein
MVLAKQSGMYIRRLLRFFCRVRLGTANCLPSRFLTYLVGQALEMPRWWSCLAFQETQAPGTSPDNTALVATVFLLAASSLYVAGTYRNPTLGYERADSPSPTLQSAEVCFPFGKFVAIQHVLLPYFASEEHERMTGLLPLTNRGHELISRVFIALAPWI